jgi:hypothetical protein
MQLEQFGHEMCSSVVVKVGGEVSQPYLLVPGERSDRGRGLIELVQPQPGSLMVNMWIIQQRQYGEWLCDNTLIIDVRNKCFDLRREVVPVATSCL